MAPLTLCLTIVTTFMLVTTHAANTPCVRPAPPGFATMTAGVDITKVSIYDDAFSKHSVIAATCNKNNTPFYDPYTNVEFSHPDALDNVIAHSGGIADFASAYTSTFADLAGHVSSSITVTEGIPFIATSTQSQSFQAQAEVMAEQDRLIVFQVSFITALELNLLPTFQLTPSSDFLNAINTLLPTDITFGPATVTAYNTLFDNYGTHYITSLVTGGVFFSYFETDRELLNVMAQEDIEANAAASAFNILHGAGAVSGGVKTVDKAFANATIQFYQWLGGHPPADGGYPDWASSVLSTPAPRKLTLSSLSTLFYHNTTLASEMTKGIVNYAAMGFLSLTDQQLTAFLTVLNAVKVVGDPTCPTPTEDCTWDCRSRYGTNRCPSGCTHDGSPGCEDGGPYSCCSSPTSGSPFDDVAQHVTTARDALIQNCTHIQSTVKALLASPHGIVDVLAVAAVETAFLKVAAVVETPMVHHACSAHYTHDDSKAGCSGYKHTCYVPKCPGATVSNDARLSYPNGLLL